LPKPWPKKGGVLGDFQKIVGQGCPILTRQEFSLKILVDKKITGRNFFVWGFPPLIDLPAFSKLTPPKVLGNNTIVIY